MALLPLAGLRPRASRTQLAALAASRLGVLKAVRGLRMNCGLLVLAYHRIGDPSGCPFDGGVFDAMPQDLALHVRALKRWTRVLTLQEVEERYALGSGFDHPLSLITFDDAYRDNYEVALPALQAEGVPAAFFVATSFIESGQVPWWDRIAYAVKHSRAEACALSHPAGFRLEHVRSLPQAAIRTLLGLYKDAPSLDRHRFVEALEEATGAAASDSPEVRRLFVSWPELRKMAEAGMSIGSHTHTHSLLGGLSYVEQCDELERSRALLAERAGVEVRSLAYPVGHAGGGHFNQDTRRALTALGYRLAFSHYNGWNPKPADPYDVRRMRIDRETTPEVFQATLALPSVFSG